MRSSIGTVRIVMLAAVLGAAAGCDTSPSPLLLHDWTLSAEGVRAESVTLPRKLSRALVPEEARVFRLQTRVELPPELRNKNLELSLPFLAARVTLQAGGRQMVQLSGTTDGYRTSDPHVWLIPAALAQDELELVLEVEHRWTQSGWLFSTPRLRPAGDVDRLGRFVHIFNHVVALAALIALLQMGMTSLGVYLVDRRRTPYLWFAIQAGTASSYPLFIVGYTQVLFGIYETPVLGVSLNVAVTAAIHFTHGFFELKRPSKLWWWACALASAFSLFFPGPFSATPMAGTATVLFVATTILYQLAMCIRLLRRGDDRMSAILLLMSWSGMALLGVPDFLYWLGLADVLGGVRIGCCALGLFGVWLALMLSRRHITSLNQSDQLNEELAARVEQLVKRGAEVEHLNEELRRQIGERSAQLFAALALTGRRTDHALQPTPGEVIQGRYVIDHAIGAGGMGTVFAVTRVADGRKLALKMSRELSGVALARLAREAQIAATISHPNLVSVLDVDVASSGFLYIVMELVEGTSLKDHRDRFGDSAWALPLLSQLAQGIGALHSVGVVHRDLKPANVLLTQRADGSPLVKIADFGISLRSGFSEEDAGDASTPSLDSEPVTAELGPRAVARLAARAPAPRARFPHASSLTATGLLPGTPAYIAPELVGGREHITAAADIFAFGVIAFHMLTGRRAFEDPPALALLEGRAASVAAPIASLWKTADPQIASTVDDCLAHDPRRRPTAAQLIQVFSSASEARRVTGV